jgi:hypothetical protein
MNFSQLTSAFSASAAQSRKVISADAQKGMVSTLRQTMIYLLCQQNGCAPEQAEPLLETEDLTPLLARAVRAAAARAIQEGHRRPGNASHNVRRALELTFPRRFQKSNPQGGTFAVPAAWGPVLDAVARCWTHAPTAHQNRHRIALLAKILFVAKITSPSAVPDRDRVESLLVAAGLRPSGVRNTVVAYRRVVALLWKEGSPLVCAPMRTKARGYKVGVRSLPPEAFLAGGGIPGGRAPSQLTTSELLGLICPNIADSYQEWLSAGGRTLRPSTHQHVLLHLSLLVAQLYRHTGILQSATWPHAASTTMAVPTLHELDVWHLLELRVPAGATRTGAGNSNAVRRSFVGEEQTANDTSLLWAALAPYVDRLRETSPVRGLPYANNVIDVYSSMATITSGLYEEALKDTPRWERMENARLREQSRMRAANRKAVGVFGRKDKALLMQHLSLPVLVCVVLPRMAARVRRLKAAWADTCTDATAKGHDATLHRVCRDAKRAWERSLEDYLALAVVTADPIRIKNLAHGWVGPQDEFRLTLATADDGTSRRIVEVKTFFPKKSARNPQAELKQGPEAVDDRTWRWAPAMCDFDLLLDYLMGPRLDRIVRNRLLVSPDGVSTTHTSYSLEEEVARGFRLPLFIAPEGQRGRCAMEDLSKPAGRALHYAIMTVLKRDVPAFKGRGRTPWRALLGPHVLRLLWSSYFGGVRGDHGPTLSDGRPSSGWEIAHDATSDDIATLKKHYTKVSSADRDRMRDSSIAPSADGLGTSRAPDHPHAFDPWMDRAYRLQSIEWSGENVPLPPGVDPFSPLGQPTRRARIRRARGPAAE